MKEQLFFLRQILRVVILCAITLTGVYFVSHLADIDFFHDIITPAKEGIKKASGDEWLESPTDRTIEWSVFHCWVAALGVILFLCSLVSTIFLIVIDARKTFPEIK